MKFTESYTQLKFDQRMLEMNLTRQEITPEEVKKYLESLPDLSAQAEPLFSSEHNASSTLANSPDPKKAN
jgi:uncharacterized protein Smg (DUF494 family)